jgi:hypothetical protein
MIEYIHVHFYYLYYSIGGVKHNILKEMIGQAQPLADNYPVHWCMLPVPNLKPITLPKRKDVGKPAISL